MMAPLHDFCDAFLADHFERVQLTNQRSIFNQGL